MALFWNDDQKRETAAEGEKPVTVSHFSQK